MRTTIPPRIHQLCCALLALTGFIAVAVGLTGCGTQRQWVKPGLNQADFEQDAARCRKEAARANYQDPFAFDAGQTMGLERPVAQERFFEQCMTAKGYRLKEGASER